MLIALGLHQRIEDLALGVDGAPQINDARIDFQVDFVEMPYVDGPRLARGFGYDF
jgi:hypothetical protein